MLLVGIQHASCCRHLRGSDLVQSVGFRSHKGLGAATSKRTTRPKLAL